MKSTFAIIGLLLLAGIIMFIDLSYTTAKEVESASTPSPALQTEDGPVASAPVPSATGKPVLSASATPAPAETASPKPSEKATQAPESSPSSQPENEQDALQLFNDYDGSISAPKILVYKELRRLELYDGKKLIARFKIVLGFEPVGNKLKEGDGKTPVGEYYVCERNPSSSSYKSVGLSYPNTDDAKRGLDEGVIDQAAYDKIKSAIDKGDKPPWDTAMGGDICIHGEGSDPSQTKGCVSVVNEEMDIVWDCAPIGTKVIIYD